MFRICSSSPFKESPKYDFFTRVMPRRERKSSACRISCTMVFLLICSFWASCSMVILSNMVRSTVMMTILSSLEYTLISLLEYKPVISNPFWIISLMPSRGVLSISTGIPFRKYWIASRSLRMDLLLTWNTSASLPVVV